MSVVDHYSNFVTVATKVGAVVTEIDSLADAAAYISGLTEGACMCPPSATLERIGLKDELKKLNVEIVDQDFRKLAKDTPSAVTSANFAIGDSGTLVLESTAEDVRLATMLSEKHFVIFDPKKILADGIEAAEPMRQLHQQSPSNYVAYITGPSRTADIERVLTIGVHGPLELHILLLKGISSDPLES